MIDRGSARNESDGAGLLDVVREWGRIGVIGFGGPPAHIALLRELCVERRRWLSEHEFEDAVAACNLLPGPASTQLAIFCAARVRGTVGGFVGGTCFIAPGLALIVALSALFLASSPPTWVLAAGAGAGAAVPAVAVHAALSLMPSSYGRTAGLARVRWLVYVALGALGAAVTGPWVVAVLLGCGLCELLARLGASLGAGRATAHGWHVAAALLAAAAPAGLGALAWTAFKVGALSYGGGFVIIPLMQADAVTVYHWMSEGQFLNAVALGQVTPGPVTHTVAAVGYAAAGLDGALIAAGIAFAPSFALVLGGRRHFDALRGSSAARAFLEGAGPAAIGAILGAALPLALALDTAWQLGVLAAAAVALLAAGRGIVSVLVGAGAIGVVAALALGAPLPAA